MNEKVAIIDVGSNSIKLLVAQMAPGGSLITLESRALDTRISKGISSSEPILSEAGMIAGIDAIRELLRIASAHTPTSFDLVATSAVRSAKNGNEFCARVKQECGLPLRVLSGEEEARLIGRGLICDPELSSLSDFFLFDLGGGSLECLSFVGRLPKQAISLPLGCVRLTEKFITDPTAPVEAAAQHAISDHVLASFAASGFRFSSSPTKAVLAGGSMTTARVILNGGKSLAGSAPCIPLSTLDALARQACKLPLSERSQQMPGLPAPRADVFPTALITMLAVAKAGGFDSFYHSLHNLRYGLAADLLQKKASG